MCRLAINTIQCKAAEQPRPSMPPILVLPTNAMHATQAHGGGHIYNDNEQHQGQCPGVSRRLPGCGGYPTAHSKCSWQCCHHRRQRRRRCCPRWARPARASAAGARRTLAQAGPRRHRHGGGPRAPPAGHPPTVSPLHLPRTAPIVVRPPAVRSYSTHSTTAWHVPAATTYQARPGPRNHPRGLPAPAPEPRPRTAFRGLETAAALPRGIPGPWWPRRVAGARHHADASGAAPGDIQAVCAVCCVQRGAHQPPLRSTHSTAPFKHVDQVARPAHNANERQYACTPGNYCRLFHGWRPRRTPHATSRCGVLDLPPSIQIVHFSGE